MKIQVQWRSEYQAFECWNHSNIQLDTSGVVYFDQLSAAARNWNLKHFFQQFSTFFVIFKLFSRIRLKTAEKNVSTSFRVHAAPKSWSKYLFIQNFYHISSSGIRSTVRQGKSPYTEWYWRISELSHRGWIWLLVFYSGHCLNNGPFS